MVPPIPGVCERLVDLVEELMKAWGWVSLAQSVIGGLRESLAVCGKTWTSRMPQFDHEVYHVEAFLYFEPPWKSSSESPSPQNGDIVFYVVLLTCSNLHHLSPPPTPRTAIICLNSYLLEIQELVNRVYSFDLPMIHTRNLTSPQLVSIL
jgi:hypothetical protein